MRRLRYQTISYSNPNIVTGGETRLHYTRNTEKAVDATLNQQGGDFGYRNKTYHYGSTVAQEIRSQIAGGIPLPKRGFGADERTAAD